MTRGSCLCGTVRFEILGGIEEVEYCHCSLCRKATGSAFGAFGFVSASDFKLISGEDRLRSYSSSVGVQRTFCSACGAPLQWKMDRSPGRFGVALGLLDGDSGVRPKGHIHTASKAAWYTIEDSLPSWREEPPEDQI